MNKARSLRFVIANGYEPDLISLQREMRNWLEARGAKVVLSQSGAVCLTCHGRGTTPVIQPGQCIVTEYITCPDCDGVGR